MKKVLFLLRIAIGWLFFYAGITKVINSSWSAAGYLSNAQNFQSFYSWLALPSNIGWVNFLNEWGLTLIGVSLILGIFVRWSALAGILVMILYYLPILSFPHVGDHGYLVDEHIIYILVLLVLMLSQAGNTWGIDKYIKRR